MAYRVRIKLKELLYERGITQKQLAEMTGLRENTIGEIARGTKTAINFKHLEKIASALNISDIRNIMALEER